MLLLNQVLALAGALFFFVILGRPRFLRSDTAPAQAANLSIIIPARDEEDELGGLLDTIRAQDVEARQIIVVDDASQDATARIARERGATVLAAGELPAGWKGKTWACQRGADAAQGEWLLFLDADTRFEPGGLAKLIALTRDSDRVYSVCPYHEIRSPVEELSAFFNVMMVAGSAGFGMPSRAGEGLFGQCLLISRTHYEAVGGHASVRGELLENFQLGPRLAALGIQRRCYMGRGALRMRMFGGGFLELWRSWQKGFTTATGAAPRIALVGCTLWITGAMLAIAGAVLTLLSGIGSLFRVTAVIAYAVYVTQTLVAFRLVGNFSVLNAVFFPISLLFYQVLFFFSLCRRALGGTTVWKGRDVG